MGGSKEKIYTSLTVEKLMDTPSDYYKAIEKEIFKKVKSGTKAMNKSYKRSIVESRGLFNEGYLNKTGFNPVENIQYKALDSDLLLSWCKLNINSAISSIYNVEDSDLTYEDVIFKNVQTQYGSNFVPTRKVIISDGKEYKYKSCVMNGTNIESTFRVDINTTAESYRVAHSPTLAISSVSDTGSKIHIVFNNNSVADIDYDSLHFSFANEVHTLLIQLIDSYNANNTYTCSSADDSTNATNGTTGIVYTNVDYDTGIDDYSWYAMYKVTLGLDSNGNLVSSSRIITTKITNRLSNDNSLYLDTINAKIKEKELSLIDKLKKEMLTTDDYIKFIYLLNEHTYFSYINKNLHQDLISTKNYKSYPIIPLKKNGAFYGDDNKKFKALVNKLGLNAQDFKDQLSDGKISEAVIGYVIRLDATDDTSAKYIYDFIDKLIIQQIDAGKNSYSGNIANIEFNNASINTQLNCAKQTFPGSIPGTTGKVGTYKTYIKTSSETVPDTDENGNQYMNGSMVTVTTKRKVFCKQINANYYEEITVNGGSTKVTSSGYSVNNKIERVSTDEAYSEIMIPLVKDIIKHYNQVEFCYILASSINLIIIAVQRVKIAWYQTGFWKFVFTVVGTVAAFYTGGATAAAVYMLLTIAIESGILTGTALKIVIIVMAIYTFANAYTNYAGFSSQIAMAQSLVQVASVAQQINSEGVLRHAQKEYEAAKDKNEETQKKMDELNKTVQEGVWIGISDREPESLYYLSSTDFMCNNDILFDTDYSIERLFPPE